MRHNDVTQSQTFTMINLKLTQDNLENSQDRLWICFCNIAAETLLCQMWENASHGVNGQKVVGGRALKRPNPAMMVQQPRHSCRHTQQHAGGISRWQGIISHLCEVTRHVVITAHTRQIQYSNSFLFKVQRGVIRTGNLASWQFYIIHILPGFSMQHDNKSGHL